MQYPQVERNAGEFGRGGVGTREGMDRAKLTNGLTDKKIAEGMHHNFFAHIYEPSLILDKSHLTRFCAMEEKKSAIFSLPLHKIESKICLSLLYLFMAQKSGNLKHCIEKVKRSVKSEVS